MTLKAAVDRLGTWVVTGVVTNYGNDDYPGIIPHTELPALLVLGAEEGEGAKAFNVSMTQARVAVAMSHYLLVKGAGIGRPQARMYDSLALVDNYYAKVVTDWLLNGTLLEPLRITDTTFGLIQIGNGTYYGVTFRHEWVLAL
jgi:hypothetical protein